MPQDLGAAGYLARPPVPPPQMPTLSTMKSPTSGGPTDMDESEHEVGGEMRAKGDAVLKLFFDIEQDLKQLALVAPGQSEGIDEIMTKLKDVRTAIINGGADKDNTIPDQSGSAGPIKR